MALCRNGTAFKSGCRRRNYDFLYSFTTTCIVDSTRVYMYTTSFCVMPEKYE